jgi:hypothetical protein
MEDQDQNLQIIIDNLKKRVEKEFANDPEFLKKLKK